MSVWDESEVPDGSPLVEPASGDFSVHESHDPALLLLLQLRPLRVAHLDHEGEDEE